jgi:hypothetical protein
MRFACIALFFALSAAAQTSVPVTLSFNGTGTGDISGMNLSGSGTKHEEFNHVSSLTLTSGRIMVVVTEGILSNNPNIVGYELDSNFSVLSAALGDYAMARFRDLEAKGEIPMDSLVREGERLRSEVRIRRRSA